MLSEIELLDKYRPLVISVAKAHRGCGLDLDDLIQEGTIGLIKAIRKYDPSLRYSIGPYAKQWIRGEILQAINRNKLLITGTDFEIAVPCQINEDLQLKQGLELLPVAMKVLNSNQTAVIKERWLQDTPAKLKTLSDELGISIERVRQIEIASISKLKVAMSDLGFSS